MLKVDTRKKLASELFPSFDYICIFDLISARPFLMMSKLVSAVEPVEEVTAKVSACGTILRPHPIHRFLCSDSVSGTD